MSGLSSWRGFSDIAAALIPLRAWRRRNPEQAVFLAASCIGLLLAVGAMLGALFVHHFTDASVWSIYGPAVEFEVRADAVMKARQDARTLILTAAGACIAFLSWLTTYYLKSREAGLLSARESREMFASINRDLVSSDLTTRLTAIGALAGLCDEPGMRSNDLLRAMSRAAAAATLLRSTSEVFDPDPKSYSTDPPIIGPESLTALQVLSATYRLDQRRASLQTLQIGDAQIPFVEGCDILDGVLRRVWVMALSGSRLSRTTLQAVLFGRVTDITFFGCYINRCEWRGARLQRVSFESCDFHVIPDGKPDPAFNGSVTIWGETWLEMASTDAVRLQQCRLNGRPLPDGELVVSNGTAAIREGDSSLDLTEILRPPTAGENPVRSWQRP